MKLSKIFITFLFGLFMFASSYAQKPYPLKTTTEEQTQPKTKKPEPKRDYGPPKQNILKLNLLSPVYSNLMLFYEHNLSRESSFQLGLGYMNFDGFGGTDKNPHTEAIFAVGEYRYLLTGSTMDGTYISPFIKYTSMSYAEDNINNWIFPTVNLGRNHYSYQSAGIGICLGQQYLYKNKVSIDIYGGPVYNMLLSRSGPGNDVIIDQAISNINVKGYGLRAGLTIGFLF
jgi:hypothetical protein